MTEEKTALNEIPAEVYYNTHLRTSDRTVKAFVLTLGGALSGKIPSAIYAVGSSTWTKVICDDHHIQFPRSYNDIDLRVCPLQAAPVDQVELEILHSLGRLGIDSRVDTEPKKIGNTGVYIHIDYARRVIIEHGEKLPKVELILRPNRRTNYLRSLEEELKEERNFDPNKKVFAFSLLYVPPKKETETQ